MMDCILEINKRGIDLSSAVLKIVLVAVHFGVSVEVKKRASSILVVSGSVNHVVYEAMDYDKQLVIMVIVSTISSSDVVIVVAILEDVENIAMVGLIVVVFVEVAVIDH